MRALTPYEMDLITGGKFSQTQNAGIYVTANPPEPDPTPPPGDPAGGPGGGIGGGGGTGGSPPTGHAAIVHEQQCPSIQAAATSIANDIKQTAVANPTGANWTNIEYGTLLISEGNGTYGAGDHTIFTADSNHDISYPYPTLTAGQAIVGTMHSHPDTGDNDHNLASRYPSDDDWENLARIAYYNHLGNISMYLMDPFGVVREFSLVDRYTYQRYLSPEDKRAGERLPPPNTTPGCS